MLTPISSDFCENHVLVGYITNGKIWSIYRRFADVKDDNRTEIPVSHFTDLMHDRIAPWRLAEDGFTTLGGLVYSKHFTIDSEDGKITRKVTVITDTGRVYLNEGPTNVTTYTDLLTLIRMIG